MGKDTIRIRGARVHNLKNIDVDIPRNKLVVLTGISGSGKSSLAFDTIYAEGQRRYVESLSAYARQFLGLMDKPDCDAIEGLSPSISIDQKGASHNPRSTVGTMTEIYDYLRLLFARVGHPHCPTCGREISQQSPQQIVDHILSLASQAPRGRGLRLLILAPIIKDRRGEYQSLFVELFKKGIARVRIDGVIRETGEDFVLIKTNKHSIDAVIDRFVIGKKERSDDTTRIRLTNAIETALNMANGQVIASEVLDASFSIQKSPKKMRDHLFSEHFACPSCNISLPEIEPRTFSFNSPHGACSTCTGLGTILEINPSRVLNPRLTIREGGVLPWNRATGYDTWRSRLIEAVAQAHNFRTDRPIQELSPHAKQLILYGTGDQLYRVVGENRYGRTTSFETTFEGIVPNLLRRHRETQSDYVRRDIERFMKYSICPSCHGTRLRKEALAITIHGKNIAAVTRASIDKTDRWVRDLTKARLLSPRESVIAKPILRELLSRLHFLRDVGLHYLTLDRSASTLAGGETQRIRLASQIGSGLTGVLYVLDEPSIGLHQRDNRQLIRTLQRLRDLGNTVIVVEHDEEMIRRADWIVDFGPGAGKHGGTVVATGPPEKIQRTTASLTGKYLSGKRTITIPQGNLRKSEVVVIRSAAEHNLKQIDVPIPLGNFIAVTGVSGSGKSTLVHDIFYRALAQHLHGSRIDPGKHARIEHLDAIDKAVLVDQSPIGRTPRSNPVTYTGAFTMIRDLFARSPEARARGYKLGRFSFNVKGGRCAACEGEGQVKIEMQFLPDVYVDCDVCHGSRYNRETLEIRFKEKSIADILHMTVDEALSFFAAFPSLTHKLQTIKDVGLGYITLGQPAPTLSGGEAQRVKLATELAKRSTGQTVYILDEPTTGLHFADIERLLLVLRRLVDRGNTVIIIEHNLDVICNVDWIIDLGPEGGEAGGKIVAQGTPEQIAQHKSSYTGQFLKKMLLRNS